MATKIFQKNIDFQLLFITLALLGLGLAILYSASTVESYRNFQNTTYYIIHQIINGAVFGLIALIIFSQINYHFWQKYLPWLILIALILLALVKVPHFGASFGGATRWLNLKGILFQPAELAKLVLIFYIASWVDKKHQHLNDFFFGFLPTIIIILLFAALIFLQPDFGTMLVLLTVSFLMLVASGINWQYFAILGGLSVPILYLLVRFESYRFARLTAFLNPTSDLRGIGYQINQALLAIGAGQLFGYGYGLSRQKHYYLPEVMTDSIFAVLAEELGFFRAAGIILLFILFALKGMQISKNAPDTFGKLTAFGITCWISVQALINIAAMLKLLPLTGIPLPFFSYGSTALIMNLSAVGILLNISKYAKLSR